eukprot:Selendium_serpulae@DN3436_c0_g1_i2.p1
MVIRVNSTVNTCFATLWCLYFDYGYQPRAFEPKATRSESSIPNCPPPHHQSSKSPAISTRVVVDNKSKSSSNKKSPNKKSPDRPSAASLAIKAFVDGRCAHLACVKRALRFLRVLDSLSPSPPSSSSSSSSSSSASSSNVLIDGLSSFHLSLIDGCTALSHSWQQS